MLRIELSGLTVRFGPRIVMDHVDATLSWNPQDDRAWVIGLMGPSGAGKTTLAREILSARYEGGRPGVSLHPPDMVIGYLPQTPVLYPHLSARRNARLFEAVGRYRSRFDASLFEQLTESLRLGSVLRSQVNVERLSGGEAQRLMLLRTLSVRPDLLILDEPASGLDATVREAFLIDLHDLLGKLGIAALYISHHWAEVAFLADQVAYADTPGGASVTALPIVATEDFADAPPQIDAFRSVYGPGCSVWPLKAGGRIACFKAEPGRTGGYRRLEPNYRLSETLAADLEKTPIRAALYADNRFETWAEVGLGQLRELT